MLLLVLHYLIKCLLPFLLFFLLYKRFLIIQKLNNSVKWCNFITWFTGFLCNLVDLVKSQIA